MYKLKFTILSLSENGISDVFVNDKADKIELSYYQSIVSFIIAQTINGKNPHFKILNRNDNQNAINYMIEFFKDYSDEHKIDPLQILKNFIPLNFVIALDRESGLDIFFNNLDSECVLTKNVNNLEGNIFTWQDKLPLGTNLLMNYYFDKENLVVITKEKISKNLMYFNYIYQKNNMEDGYYQLPEGLIKLNWREDCNNYADKNIKIQEIMLANLKKDVKNKILVMPSTLEDATGQIVIPIKGCVLNENIKHITDSLFSKQKFDVINVPSNLDYATSSLPKFVKSVIFTNFQNTLVFNNQEVADKYNASGYLTNLIDINQNKDKIIVSFNLYQIIFHNLQNNESIKVDPKILELTLDFEPRRCYDYEEKQKYYGELRSQMCNHFLNYARHILSSK